MSKKGCKNFADLLTAGTGEASKSFSDSVSGGLTVFCPNDGAVKGFAPKFKNLTADGKISLLLYHGVPVYYSLSSLKSSNGVMNTLATDGVAKNYNFTVQNNGEIVTIKSAGTTASIKTTVVDKDPLAVYSVDEVLEPAELFKPAEVPSPAPSPAEAASCSAEGREGEEEEACGVG
ncbi:fasciclin-like arabinogalactan protein 1 [Asparagus officinalis]|uniref:fasciclin-like arabinogalactan protein 1 n=1 Tax=Asparagus officinalis TaxID=4686 RepID=UPI00098E2A85|nr:fasciclin-like arabinogalactan protein 1 [Asparagus officinalis]